MEGQDTLNASLAVLNDANANLLNYDSMKEANAVKLQIAREANLYDYEKWLEMNKYNAPAAQMSRLADAGLNPNLIYGTGSVTGNTASAVPRAHTADYQAPMLNSNMANLFLSVSAMKKNAAQTDLIQQQEQNAKIDALFKTAQTTGVNLSNQEKQNLLDYQTRNLEADLFAKQLKNQVEAIRAEKQLPLEIAQKASETERSKHEADRSSEEAKMARIKRIFEEQLKEYNMTPNDPALLRGLLYFYNNQVKNWFN